MTVSTTNHRVTIGDARSLGNIATNSVELVVTSPPYPMIEMWDDLFAELNPQVETLLEAGAARAAFDAMHAELARVWDELSRVVVPGGIVCINIGDATRKVEGSFRQYPNHCRVTNALCERGFETLPSVLWRKPVNSPAKYMGSGTIPPNQYVTLEHEHILVFRNGPESRQFEANAEHRYESAYFWEERNAWFTDLWTDVQGIQQDLSVASNDSTSEDHRSDDDATPPPAAALRERSAAYPFEIPYRLINMYSTYGDTVLDPFWGTGTTTTAAMVAARNSVGCEYDPAFAELFDEHVAGIPTLSTRLAHERLAAHQRFTVTYRTDAEDNSLKYSARNYDFPVKTKREQGLQLYAVESVDAMNDDHGYIAVHEPVSEARPETLSFTTTNESTPVTQATFQTNFQE